MPLLPARKRGRFPKALVAVTGLTGLSLAAGLATVIVLGQDEELTAPARLAGLDRSPSAPLNRRANEIQRAIEANNDGVVALAAAYGQPGGRIALLHAVRGRIDIDKEFSEAQVDGPLTRVGASMCAPAGAEHAVLCLRSTDELSVGVMGYRFESPEAVARTLDEAWLDSRMAR